MLGPDDLVLCAGSVFGTPLLDRLAPARDNGFTAISVQPADYQALRSEGMSDADIRSCVADHGLAIAEVDAVTTWFAGHEPPASWGAEAVAMFLQGTADALCPLARALGARSLNVVEFFGVEVDVDRAAEGFAGVCDRAAEDGLLAHLEFLPWGGVPDLATAWEIVKRANRANGGLVIDSWHLFRSGAELAELGAIPGDRVVCIQLDDAPAISKILIQIFPHSCISMVHGPFLPKLAQSMDPIYRTSQSKFHSLTIRDSHMPSNLSSTPSRNTCPCFLGPTGPIVTKHAGHMHPTVRTSHRKFHAWVTAYPRIPCPARICPPQSLSRSHTNAAPWSMVQTLPNLDSPWTP